MKQIIKKNFKRGIAMVELIFALVIMGIVLLSAPTLIQQSIQSSNVALQQESIAALSSHMGILLSKYWDEGDTNLSAGVAPIITLNSEVIGSPYHFNGIDANVTGRTSSVANVTVLASAIGQDIGDFDDIDDYNGIAVNLTVFNAENTTVGTLGDYVDVNINISTNVTFADDRPLITHIVAGELQTNILNEINATNNIFSTPVLVGGMESNIKFIQATLTTTNSAVELDKNITLRAFSCNLGTYSLGGIQY